MDVTRKKIFLSSAMEPSKEFDWAEIRESVRDKLRENKRLTVYDIGECASPNESNQEMKNHIKTSDYIVQIIGEELRQGTKKEHHFALEFNKKIFSFFLKTNSHDKTVNQHLEDLGNINLYNNKYTSDTIAKAVYENVLEYIYNCENYYTENIMNDVIGYKIADSESYVDKSVLKDSGNRVLGYLSTIFDDLEKDDGVEYNESELVTINLLNFLTGKSNIISIETMKKFIVNLKDSNELKPWLIDRVNAFYYFYANHNYDLSLKYLDDSLKKAIESNIAEWIINGIRVDARNVKILIGRINKQYLYNSEYQTQIQESKISLFSPQSDRYMKNSYSLVLNEISKINLSTDTTVFFGTSLSTVLNEIEKATVVNFCNVSIVGLELTRVLLADALYHFGVVYENGNLIFESYVLYIATRNYKKAEQILSKHWDLISDLAIVSIQRICDVVEKIDDRINSRVKINVFSQFGNYMSEELFLETSIYILKYCKQVDNSNSREYLRAVESNQERLKQNDIVKIVIELLSKEWLINIDKVLELLIHINFKKVSEDLKMKLIKSLKENSKRIIEKSGMAEVYSLLAKKDPIFIGLANDVETELIGKYKMFHYLNYNSDKFDDKKTIDMLIDDLNHQIKQNSGGVYHQFGNRPILTLINLLYSRINFSPFKDYLIEYVVPKFRMLLNENLHGEVKQEILEFFCVFSLLCAKNEIIYTLGEVIVSDVDVKKLKYDIFGNHSQLNLNILMYIINCMNGDNKTEIMLNLLDLASLNIHERIVLSKSLSRLAEFNYIKGVKTEPINAYLICKLSRDENSIIRNLATRGLYNLFIQNHELATEGLINSLINDNTYYVRKSILRLLMGSSEDYNYLFDNLNNDSDFRIRFQMKEYLDNKVM